MNQDINELTIEMFQLFEKIDIKIAIHTLLIIFGGIVVFHILILSGLLPYNLVWGSRLENASQMRNMEIISIIINLAVIYIVGMKGGYAKPIIPAKMITILLWVFAALFTLNTIGNLFSQNIWETIIFTPLTLLSVLLFIRLAIDKQ